MGWRSQSGLIDATRLGKRPHACNVAPGLSAGRTPVAETTAMPSQQMRCSVGQNAVCPGIISMVASLWPPQTPVTDR